MHVTITRDSSVSLWRKENFVDLLARLLCLLLEFLSFRTGRVVCKADCGTMKVCLFHPPVASVFWRLINPSVSLEKDEIGSTSSKVNERGWVSDNFSFYNGRGICLLTFQSTAYAENNSTKSRENASACRVDEPAFNESQLFSRSWGWWQIDEALMTDRLRANGIGDLWREVDLLSRLAVS